MRARTSIAFVVVLVLTGSQASSSSAATSHRLPGCTTAKAWKTAESLHEAHPQWINAVATSAARADAALDGRHRLPRDPTGARAVLVEMKGRFVGDHLSYPLGAKAPTGRYVQLMLRPADCEVVRLDLTQQLVRLRRVGAVHHVGVVVRRGLDLVDGVAFRLAGATLTVSLDPQPHSIPPDVRALLFGARITAACGHSQTDEKKVTHATRRWRRGARRVTFHLPRNLAVDARWCLVENANGSDIATARMH